MEERRQAKYAFLAEAARDPRLKELLAGLAAASRRHAAMLKTEALSREYERVVVATGDGDAASRLGIWQESEQVAVKGAVVLGEFAPQAASIWLDTRYAGHGFGHLVPLGRERASLHLCVGGIGLKQLDDYWHMFLEAEGLDRYPVVEAFEMLFHCGRLQRRQVKNLLFGRTSRKAGCGAR